MWIHFWALYSVDLCLTPWPIPRCLDYCNYCLKSTFFNFQVFGDSPVTDFQFNSTVVRKNTVYDFSSFKFSCICFMAQDMVYLGESSIGTWKKAVYSILFNAVFYKYLLGLLVDCIFRFCFFADFLPFSLSVAEEWGSEV